MTPIQEMVSPYLNRGKLKGQDIVSLCPFHDDHKASFAINIYHGLWLCYAGCGYGNLWTFLKAIGKSQHEIDSLINPHKEAIQNALDLIQLKKRHRLQLTKKPTTLCEAVLGPYDYNPIYMLMRGFTVETLQEHEIGYDNRLDRVIFPVRNTDGDLVGISGRTTIYHPTRYKFYESGNQDTPGDFGPGFDEMFPDYEFHKSEHLWNIHRITGRLRKDTCDDPVIIVEGFKAALWLIQNGYKLTVATMGSSMSRRQTSILAEFSNPIIIFYDNDEAGLTGAQRAARYLSRSNLHVYIVRYPEEKRQPDDFKNMKSLQQTIDKAERFLLW